jgi:hypothetical protein
MNVLTKGLHCIQGRIAIGTAKAADVTIANQVYHIAQVSVSLSSVTPNEILLKVIAITEIVSPDAP